MEEVPYFIFLKTIFKNILDDKTASLTKRNLVPATVKSLVDILHDLWWIASPAELKQLLPNMASICRNQNGVSRSMAWRYSQRWTTVSGILLKSSLTITALKSSLTQSKAF